MNPQFRFRLRLVPAMLGAVALVVAATARLIAASPERAADEQAIRAAAAAYQKAVESGDEAAVASLWLADGDIIDAAGNRIAAPVAAAAPTSPDGAGSAGSGTVAPECRVSPTSIRFVGPDTAIEDGTLEIVPQTGAALAGRFSAVWVRHEGRWKLAAVREAASEPPMGAEALAELDWLVGDWLVVEDPDAPTEPGRPAIEVSARWNDERTFLTRELTSTVAPGEPPVRITQRIGWDPLAKSIHSWVFGSDGTHGEAIWTRDGQSWIAQARTVGPDGTQGSTVTTYTPVGQDRCLWRSVPTDVGGRQLPAVDLVMVRKPRPQGGTTGSQP
jgi:uncharacterized protein (TIGR02246 family)